MATAQVPGATPAAHSIEAEESVLGAILLVDSSMYGIVIEQALKPEDFYREQHRIVFRAMVELYDEARPIDTITLVEHLRQTGHLDDVGGDAAIHRLAGPVPAAGNVLHYAQIVKDNALLRRLMTTTYEIQARVANRDSAPRDLVEQAERAMLEVAHDDRQKDFRWIHDILDVELEKLQKLSKDGTALTGTPTGFKDLDGLTGGFQPGNLIVIAARPAMGKSALVTNIAENVALDHRQAVALFSLEMSETELAQRFIASQARIKGDDLRKGRVADSKWPKILEASSRLANAPLYVDDSSDIGLLEIRAKSRRLHQREPLGMIIVDYLQLLRADGRIENRVEQVGQMSRGLKILARELDVPVVALSQLNRSVEARTDKRPLLSDLRESGCLTGDARVYLPDTGTYQPIRELVGQCDFSVLALNRETWRLERCRVTNAFSTGTKPVHRLTTQLGRTVKATANHRFLTIDGWRRLDELEPGTRIALPRELAGSATASMTRDELALLGHLIGDGCTLPTHAIQYTTNDAGLAKLVARLAERAFGKRIRPRVNRERHAVRLTERVAERTANTNRDVIARDVWRGLVVPAMQDAGLTTRAMQAALPLRYCGSALYKSNLGRERAGRVAEVVRSEELARLASSDVYWDQIASIEPDGVEEVYDLTVDRLHNFVAEDIVVHNSIEQDSDVVMFIYRDEYYNKDSEDEGIAELIVSKHRNGPIDTVRLTFQKDYPKFMNYAGQRFDA